MSTKMLFYIVKGIGLIKRGMRVKRKCNHFKGNQGFSSKSACHKKKKLTCHQGINDSLLSCLSCQNNFMFLNRRQHVDVTDSLAEDEGELLFLFDTSSHKVFREENDPFRPLFQFQTEKTQSTNLIFRHLLGLNLHLIFEHF